MRWRSVGACVCVSVAVCVLGCKGWALALSRSRERSFRTRAPTDTLLSHTHVCVACGWVRWYLIVLHTTYPFRIVRHTLLTHDC